MEKLPVKVDHCPSSWNLTTTDPEPPSDWWSHSYIYELSYMWYSGVSCCIVLVLGSVLSLLPYLRQHQPPHSDLVVPVMEVPRLLYRDTPDSPHCRSCSAVGRREPRRS